MTPGDVFIGYHSDAVSSVVLKVCKDMGEDVGEKNDQEALKSAAWAQQVSHQYYLPTVYTSLISGPLDILYLKEECFMH